MPETTINFVNFKVGTSTNYAALDVKDPNTLYFLSDTLQIMKGSENYASSVIIADVLPDIDEGIIGKIYIVGTDLYIKAMEADEAKWQKLVDLSTKADLSGATFTGSVVLAADPEEAMEAATKQYVDNEVDSKLAANDAMRFKGTLGEGGTIENLPTENVRQGDTYKIISAGQYAGVNCEIGDIIIALENVETGSTDDNWVVAQGNIDGAVTGPVSSVSENIAVFDGTTGKVIKDSSKAIGGEALAETPDADTIATEAAVKAYADSLKPVWVEI